ncbi:MAG: tetratricopeptide repeat protein, partial [Planctomycetota bacterium]
MAVLGFKNLSQNPESAWLSTALTEMLSAELAAGERMRNVPGENVERMKVELALPDSDSLSADTLARVRGNIGADLVVIGSFVTLAGAAGQQLRLDVRLQNTGSGETAATVVETGSQAQLFEVVQRVGESLRARMGGGRLTSPQVLAVRASVPARPEAVRPYAEGLDHLRRFDALGARDFLEKAVAADPDAPMPRSALAEALMRLGYRAKAKEMAKSAVERAGVLGREERLLVEGRAFEIGRALDQAVARYQALAGFFPDDLEYGLHLATAQRLNGKPKDALATLDALQKLPAPAGDDPRIDLNQAIAFDAVSEYPQARDAARRAAAKASARSARLLLAAARNQEGYAGVNLEDYAAALPALEEARAIYRAAGDRSGLADALRFIAVAYSARSQYDESLKIDEQELAVRREMGDRLGEAIAQNNIAVVYKERGNLKEALVRFEAARDTLKELDHRAGYAIAISNVAAVLGDLGRPDEAIAAFQQSLVLSRELGDRRQVATNLSNMASSERKKGDRAGARLHLEEGLAIRRELGKKESIAYSLFEIGQMQSEDGDVAGARRRFEEAATLRDQAGSRRQAAETRLTLAQLLFENGGDGKSAEATARTLITTFRELKARREEALAGGFLAQALLKQGRTK